MMNEYDTNNHWKGLIQYHIIFSTKYRRNLFINDSIRERCKQLMIEISNKKDFDILIQEIDISKPNHWHGLIKSCNFLSPDMIVNSLKSYSTYHLWKEFPSYLKQFYWKKHNLWTRGYFCCSIGNANDETIKKYIENQG